MARARKPTTVGRKAKMAPPEPKPRAKLLYLKAKLQRYEAIFDNLPPAVLGTLPDHMLPLVSMAGEDDDIEDNEDNEAEGAGEGSSQAQEEDDVGDGSLTDHFKQMGIYLRASRGSADHFFQAATKLSGLRSVEGEDNATAHNDEAVGSVLYNLGVLPCRAPAKKLTQRLVDLLPPIDIARQYFYAQHMYIGTIFAFSDPAVFDRQLSAAYDGPPSGTVVDNTEACLTYAKIFMILALGQLYSVNRTSSSGGSRSGDKEIGDTDSPPGLGYFAHALALLPDMHEPGSILAVETLAYVGYFFQNINRRDAAYLYIGLALRMAINLGLHQESSTSSKLSELEKEHHRRVFWSIYSLDRILSLKSGYPVAILDEDIGVKMPSQLPGEPAESPVMVLRCYTELSRILGDIAALVYRRTSATTSLSVSSPSNKGSLIATVHSILQSLNSWEKALPRHLRLDPDHGTKLSRESISMYLHYYQCINMTARPLLFHVVQKRIAAIRAAGSDAAKEKERSWESGLLPKTVAVIHACISAACNTIHIMSKAAEHNMVATYGYMDGEHAFSAAVVLALVSTAFPTHALTVEAMTKALALLRRMGDLGNVYVAERYNQLIRLQSVLEPGAEDSRTKTPLPQQPQQSRVEQASEVNPNTIQRFTPSILSKVRLQEAAISQDHEPYVVDQRLLPEDALGPPLGPAEVSVRSHNDNYQAPPENIFDFNDYDAGFFSNLDLAAIDASGVLFDPGHAGFLVPGDGQFSPNVEDTADNTLWMSAFENPTGFDISQLIPEAEMSDYFTC
ncbi:Transcriptional activator [Sporothrix epigloea]|uniref:Transcriptional activator n=1 Tax=Sporothrix epigloea TaxID=1892477 RepID=A0ABP0E3B1_9PEZI